VNAEHPSVLIGLVVAIGAPIACGGFIVLVAAGGSFLKDGQRAWVERFVFAPLFVLVGVVSVASSVWQQKWWEAAILAALFGLSGPKVLRALVGRGRAAPPATPAETRG